MRLALYQPDIPQNTGAILRLAACFAVPVEIIEPCGFPFSHKGFKRAGLDYLDHVSLERHAGWQTFLEAPARSHGRLILLTTQAATSYTEVAFTSGDTLLLGRESAGVPPEVHEQAAARVLIPMAPGLRSLNVAMSAAIVLSEALRQTSGLAS